MFAQVWSQGFATRERVEVPTACSPVPLDSRDDMIIGHWTMICLEKEVTDVIMHWLEYTILDFNVVCLSAFVRPPLPSSC